MSRRPNLSFIVATTFNQYQVCSRWTHRKLNYKSDTYSCKWQVLKVFLNSGVVVQDSRQDVDFGGGCRGCCIFRYFKNLISSAGQSRRARADARRLLDNAQQPHSTTSSFLVDPSVRVVVHSGNSSCLASPVGENSPPIPDRNYSSLITTPAMMFLTTVKGIKML